MLADVQEINDKVSTDTLDEVLILTEVIYEKYNSKNFWHETETSKIRRAREKREDQRI